MQDLCIEPLEDSKHQINFRPVLDKYLKSAQAGNTESQVKIAEAYYEARGNDQAMMAAFYWYEKAATSGDAHAQFNLGAMYYNGEGTKRDVIKAVFWFQLAAHQGDKDAEDLVLQISRKLRNICSKTGVNI